MKWILIGLPIAIVSIVFLLFVGSFFSRISDEKGKDTLRTDGSALIDKTISSFDVGTDKQPGETNSDFACDIRSESFGQPAYLYCSMIRSVTARLSGVAEQDELSYRNFYDQLLRDGWSNKLTIGDGGSGNNTKILEVKAGSELEDHNGIFEVNTSKWLKNGVSCLLWSKYYPPEKYNGTVRLSVSCNFSGSSETLFNNPTVY